MLVMLNLSTMRVSTTRARLFSIAHMLVRLSCTGTVCNRHEMVTRRVATLLKSGVADGQLFRHI